MTVYKVTVKSTFFAEAESIAEAKGIVDKAVAHLPNAECNIKATKILAKEFGSRGELP